MYSYAAFGLVIHSDVQLAGLPSGSGSPDVTIHKQPLDPDVLFSGPQGGMRLVGRLYYEPTGSDMLFLIEDGRAMTIDPVPSMEENVVESWITGVFMSALLRQRGLLVLHASTVAKDGVAIAFAGKSGWGKSTTAEYFRQQGYDVLTDDLTAIDLRGEGEEPVVFPGYPYLRLQVTALEALVGNYEALPMVNSFTDKRVRPFERGVADPVPLRALYFLGPFSAAANRVEPLMGREAVMPLIGHSRAKDMITDSAMTALHLQQCSQLLEKVHTANLHRVRQLDALPDIFSLVERDSAALLTP